MLKVIAIYLKKLNSYQDKQVARILDVFSLTGTKEATKTQTLLLVPQSNHIITY